MMIVPISRAPQGKKEEVKGEYGGIWWEEKGNADYGGMVQLSQQHIAPYVKGVNGHQPIRTTIHFQRDEIAY